MSKCLYLSLFLLCSVRLFSCYEVPAHKYGEAGSFALMRDDSGYFAQRGEKTHFIPRHEIDKKIRQMTKEELSSFLAVNYLVLHKNNNHFSVEAQGRINGGGPWTAAILGCGCAVIGAGCTLAAATGALATGHPIEAGLIAVAGTKATVAATITAAEVGLVLPLP